MGISAYISTHYDVVWSGGPGPYDTYLLAERHDSAEIRKVNGAFISQFAPPGSLLLVEGVEKVTNPPFSKGLKEWFYISDPSIPDDRVFGWDDASYFEQTKEQLDKTVALLWAKGLLLFIPQLDADPEASIETWPEKLRTFMQEGRELLVRSGYPIDLVDSPAVADKAMEFMQDVIEQMARAKEKERTASEDELAEIQEKKKKYLSGMQSDWAELLDVYNRSEDSFFHLRNYALIDTLNKIDGLVQEAGHVFLIAGHGHLVRSTSTSKDPLCPMPAESVTYVGSARGKHTIILQPKSLAQSVPLPFPSGGEAAQEKVS